MIFLDVVCVCFIGWLVGFWYLSFLVFSEILEPIMLSYHWFGKIFEHYYLKHFFLLSSLSPASRILIIHRWYLLKISHRFLKSCFFVCLFLSFFLVAFQFEKFLLTYLQAYWLLTFMTLLMSQLSAFFCSCFWFMAFAF